RYHRMLVRAEIVRRDATPAAAPRLAAMAAALGSERAPRSGGEGVRLGGLSSLVRRLSRLEEEVGADPDPFEQEFRQEWDRRGRRAIGSPAERRAAACEAWARGTEWTTLVREVEVEEGGLQRILLQDADIRL